MNSRKKTSTNKPFSVHFAPHLGLLSPSKVMNVNGLNIHYKEQGEGPALLLIHGLGADSSRWQHNIEVLAQQFRVFAIDLPGFGLSSKPDIAYRGQFFVDTIDAFLAAKEIDKIALIGNSMGGWLSMLYAQQHPEKVSRLILVAPAFYLGLPNGVTAEMVSAGAKPNTPDAMRGYLNRVLYNPPTDEVVIKQALKAHKDNNTSSAIETIAKSLAAKEDIFNEKQLKSFNKEVLLIQGDSDGIVPVSVTQNLASLLPHATMITIDESGHWPQYEQPEEFYSIVINYLKRD